MTLHPRPASPDEPTNVETDHPHDPEGHGVLTHTLFSCGSILPSNADGLGTIPSAGARHAPASSWRSRAARIDPTWDSAQSVRTARGPVSDLPSSVIS
jgi:hypothetical protein